MKTVRKYPLTYGTGENGYRSLLTSVQQQGYDDNNNLTTLPATMFTYSTTSTAFYGPNGIGGQSYVIADTNGDGISDVNHFWKNNVSGDIKYDITLGGGGGSPSGFAPDYWSDSNNPPPSIERGIRYIDVNGDGKADVVKGWKDDTVPTTAYAMSINSYSPTTTVYAWNGTTAWSGINPIFAEKIGSATILTSGIFGEVNGDGLPDYEASLPSYISPTAYLGNGSGWDATTTIFAPVQDFPTSVPTATASQLIDVNGDGLDDWLYSDSSNTYVRLNTGNGWESSSNGTWLIATSTLYHSGANYYDRGIRFMDMNGDGLVDFVRTYSVLNDAGCADTTYGEIGTASIVYLNTGNGFAASSSPYSLGGSIYSAHDVNSGGCIWTGPTFNEYFNGTGNGQMKQDVLTAVTNSKAGTTNVTYTPTGGSTTNLELPVSLLVVSQIVTNDGRGNAATTTYAYSGGKMHLTSGVRDRKFAGFAIGTTTAPDSVAVTYYNQGDGVSVGTGEQSDGYAQINRPFRKDLYDLSSNLKQRTYLRWDTISHSSSTFVGLGRQLIEDFATDGSHRDKATDYSYSSTTDDLIKTIQYGEVTGNTDGTFSIIGNNHSRTTNILYAASSSVNLSLPIEKTLLDTWYVTATSSGGTRLAPSIETNANGTASWSQCVGASSLTFSKTISATSTLLLVNVGSSVVTGVTYAGVSMTLATTSVGNSIFYLINPTTGTNNVVVSFSSSVTSGGSAVSYTTTDTINPLGAAKVNRGLSGDPSLSLTTIADNSVINETFGYGVAETFTVNSPQVQQSVKVCGGLTDEGASTLQTTTQGLYTLGWTHGGSSSSWEDVAQEILGTGTTATSSTTYVSTSTDQKLYYDSLPWGQIGFGNNTRQEDLISGITYASSTKTYNSYGLVATSTDRRGNATSYVYDAYNLYVATTTNPLSQKMQFLYNYANGKVRWQSDPNSSLTKNVFDGLGRLTEIDVSSTSTPTTYATTTTYVYLDSTSTASYIKRSDWQSAATTTDSYQFFDGFNRMFQERRVSPTSGTFFVNDRAYNTAGLLASSSLPYSSSGASSTSATTTQALFTTYTYDAIQRALKITNAVGSTTNSYFKWTTTATDPDGNVKDYWSDAFGNLVNVIEHGSSIATTTYEYDALNNLATTTDASGNVRRFTYDGLSRRLTAQDLHAVGDATFGTWTFTYDDQGNVTSQTDPKNQVVNRTYDTLNRMTTEDYTGQSGTEVTLVYDTCINGIGYLCSASSTAATTTNAYDILGRLVSATTTILGGRYNMQYQYDRQGNVTGLTYPNGSQVNVAYNLAGWPSRVQRSPSGGSFSDIISNIVYGPTGQITTTIFGSGASTTRTYDANAIYRLSQLQTKGRGGSKIQDYVYTYDAVGNMTQIANAGVSLAYATTTYSYDALNRLLSASTTVASSTPYKQRYAYDVLGSILGLWSGTATSTYTYAGTNYANPHAVTQAGNGVSTTTYAYDNNGNLTSAGTGTATTTYTYDYANRLIALFSGGATTTYGYDAFGARVYQIIPNTATTSYPWKFFSVASTTRAATSTEYIFNGDTLLATADVTGTTTSSSGSSISTSTPAYIQSKLAKDVGGASNSVTFTSAVTTGNLIVVGITVNNQTVTSNAISDNKGNTYTKASEAINGLNHAAVFYAKNVTGGSSFIVSSNIGDNSLSAHEYSGVSTSSPLDKVATSTGTSATVSSGNVTTTLANELYFGLAWSGGDGDTWTAGSGYTKREEQTNDALNERMASEDATLSSASTTAARFTTSSSAAYAANLLTFKPLVTTTQGSSSTSSPSTTIRYVHPDHLNSTDAVTDPNQNVVQVLDYYPYGGTRINSSTGGADVKKKYVSRELDQSNLYYLMARYYDPSRGQFVSQDPMFWSTKQNLLDPQSLNSYSYASDNPITKKDPDGLLTQAQNTQLNGIKAQLQSISAQLSAMQASGGSVSQGSLSSIQSSINSAGVAISRIAVGGNATMGPSYQWAPQTSNKSIIPYTPNVANGVVPVYGTDSDKLFALGLLTMLPVPGGEYLFGGATAAKFFEGSVYSEKVLQQMSKASDLYHAFPELVRTEGAGVARISSELGGDGTFSQFLRIPGSINGTPGDFTFIKNTETIINERFFRPY